MLNIFMEVLLEFIDRKVFHNILRFLGYKEAIIIYGARQVGKTTIMKMIINHLKNNNIPEEAIFYLDLEDLDLLQLCEEGIDSIIKYIEARTSYKKKIYIFIDEIQYLNNPANFIKIMVDNYSDRFKIILSGSSVLGIKSKIKQSLVGRIVTFEVFCLDFEEFLRFKGIKYNLLSVEDDKTRKELIKLFKEFVIFGGYPRSTLIHIIEDKKYYLKELVQTYIKKDIKDIGNVGNIMKFNNLLRILASQTGNLLNIDEISSSVKIAKETVYHYLALLEGTYIARRLPPFFRNVRSELTKMPKIYFEDNGILNYLRYNDIIETIDGQAFENCIYTEFQKIAGFNNLKYWRTQAKQEIDFIVEKKGKLFAFETKMAYSGKKVSGLKYFSKKYSNSKIFAIVLKQTKSSEQQKNISVIYPWEIERNL